MSSETPPKATIDSNDSFSPTSTPRTQQRRALYRFWNSTVCLSLSKTDNSTPESQDAVLPSTSSTFNTPEQIIINVIEPKPDQIKLDHIRTSYEEPLSRDYLPSSSEEKPAEKSYECAIDLSDSNSTILKLDVNEGAIQHSSFQVDPGDETCLENNCKGDEPRKESSEEDCCRICQNNENSPNELVSPCYCSGSLGKMHVACLNQWLQFSKRKQCELCRYKYTFTKEKLKFTDFLRDPELKDKLNELMWDLLRYFLITFLFTTSMVLILIDFQQRQWHMSWDVLGLEIIGLAQLFVYMVWVRNWFPYLKRLWEGWKEKHKVMKLVIQKAKVPKRQANSARIVKRRVWHYRRRHLPIENAQNIRVYRRYRLNRPNLRRVQ